ncbi:leucine-rich repeat domain-containing protein [Clostridium sporogenes]|nr:leucine-rich repeat domain-containing protein [Clostridium sporogenes]
MLYIEIYIVFRSILKRCIKMLRKIKTIVITCIFTIFACCIKVQAFQDNLNVNKDKVWTVKFNKEVQLDEATKSEIKIRDSKGEELNCNLKLGENNKSVIVDAPAGGYKPEEKYTLTVGSNIYSKNKAKLKNDTTIHFTIKKYDENAVITFKDKNLEKAVRDTIKKPNGNLYQRDVEKITRLNIVGYNIKNIDGIERLTNLQGLWMGGTKVKDISPLKSLTNLQILNATQCDIDDISPLKELSNLKYLYLSINNISDITPLKGLVNLQELDLERNNISDISPLSGLYNMKELSLNYNKINDISILHGLDNIESLSLAFNDISDISSLSGLNNLKYILLDDNKISDINALSKLYNLEYILLDYNQITDVKPLINLKNVKQLNLRGNNIKQDPEMEDFYRNIQCTNFRFDCDGNIIEF